jgi:plasmid stabilization system protein ParE
MEYRVELSPRALDDLDGIVGHIRQDSPAAAAAFQQRLLTKIGNLANFPRGYSRAPEDGHSLYRARRRLPGVRFDRPSRRETPDASRRTWRGGGVVTIVAYRTVLN